MTTIQYVILALKLISAHILTDFFFQTTKSIADKKKNLARSKYLYIHTILTAAVAYVFLMDWSNWYVPLIIFVTHTLIDLWKLSTKETFKYFFIDQLLHFLVLTFCFFLITGISPIQHLYNDEYFIVRVSLVALGYALCLNPMGYTIGNATEFWRGHLPEEANLANAGKWIGFLERSLIYTFILIGRYEAIGFLIAAKAVLRIGSTNEKDSRKISEYVLIGTLISFALSIFVGLGITYLLKII